jgi:hypothetical protein
MDTDDFDIVYLSFFWRDFRLHFISTIKLQKTKVKKVKKFSFPLPSIGNWEYYIQRFNCKFLEVSLINHVSSPK